MGHLAGIARRATTRAPMEELASADVSVAAGLTGDFRGKARRRQVTILAADAWQRACTELGANIHWTARRANLFVDGLALPERAGDLLQIGDVRLRIERETDPCSRMDEQHEGLRKALMPNWRGGVCCTVLTGGHLEIGAPVSLLRQPSAS